MALTREQTGQLKKMIEQRSNELQSEIREDVARARSEQYGELAGPAPDPGDQSVADLITDLGQADVSRDLDELRALEAAKGRIADGSYGECVSCGRDLDFQRLRANPAALRCIECQRVFEKTHAVQPSPRL
jgi:RNA polymerase-binding transcription factor DksA